MKKYIKISLILANSRPIILFIISCNFLLISCQESPPEYAEPLSWVKIISIPTDPYNPSLNNYFNVTLEAYTDVGTMPGNSWLGFGIYKKDNLISWVDHSGFIQITAGQTVQKTVEWGGGWLLGNGMNSYSLRAVVFNVIGEDSIAVFSKPEPSNAYNIVTSYPGNLPKTVEYDECGNNRVYTFARLGSNEEGRRIVRQAFIQREIDIEFQGINEQILDDCERVDVTPVASGGPGGQKVAEWIDRHREWGTDLYIAGVPGFYTNDGSTVPWGKSIEGYGSLVCYEDIDSYSQVQHYGYGHSFARQKFIQWTIVHEFGHQLGIPASAHTQNHSSVWCTMYGLDDALSGNPTDDPPPRIIFMNPHFCDNHLNQLVPGS